MLPYDMLKKRVKRLCYVLLMIDGVIMGLVYPGHGCYGVRPQSTLVFVAERPVVISVKSEIRQNVRIIARRYNTSLDLSRPIKVETNSKNNLQLILLALAESTTTISSRFFFNNKLALSKLLTVALTILLSFIFVGFIRALVSISLATTRDLQEAEGFPQVWAKM
ncbi:hypothetical protein PIB30_025034 [Stylosanthes scabra]|uniref:Uncharacterized protein n=1 Tax=Stylosanthes scabra TaxID=79078 RepID=A0ABU6RA90_9FABA|nr:hypothetical protein [Stylosanthes scabra]